jgi:hypothetical protein
MNQKGCPFVSNAVSSVANWFAKLVSAVADWVAELFSLVADWFTTLPTAEIVGFAIVAVVLILILRVTRWLMRRTWPIRRVWRHSQPRPVGSPRRKLLSRPRRRLGRWLLRRVAIAGAWHARRPLKVQPFEGPQDMDAPAVSSALCVAMTRIASLRRSGVDSVTAPAGAGAATEAIAAGVMAAPAGGELAAALLRLGWLALGRGELQLSGRVLAPSVGGPGLALSLATGSGRVAERLTIRAAEFEPSVRGEESLVGQSEADRLLRLATVGAVWTHFKVLEGEWELNEEELKRSLQTSSWRSYALMRVGIEGEEHDDPDLTRAFFAKAVDADPNNLLAQFNLASVELKDDQLVHAHDAGTKRLKLVHDTLNAEYESAEIEPGGGADAERKQLLLNRDPLNYQVGYKRVADKLNRQTFLEANDGSGSVGRRVALDLFLRWSHSHQSATDNSKAHPRPDGSTLTETDLTEITERLRDLELTLAELDQAIPSARWAAATSKSWAELRGLLGDIEGPMLVLWAMVARRIEGSEGARGDKDGDGDEDGIAGGLGPGGRVELIERLAKGSLSPEEAVAFACGPPVLQSSRTYFNLACWHADIGQPADSLSALELSLECCDRLAGERLSENQLRQVRMAHSEEWSKLESRYGLRSARVPENGFRPTQSSVRRKSLVNGARGG